MCWKECLIEFRTSQEKGQRRKRRTDRSLVLRFHLGIAGIRDIGPTGIIAIESFLPLTKGVRDGPGNDRIDAVRCICKALSRRCGRFDSGLLMRRDCTIGDRHRRQYGGRRQHRRSFPTRSHEGSNPSAPIMFPDRAKKHDAGAWLMKGNGLPLSRLQKSLYERSNVNRRAAVPRVAKPQRRQQ